MPNRLLDHKIKPRPTTIYFKWSRLHKEIEHERRLTYHKHR